jgi:hypothetical protein
VVNREELNMKQKLKFLIIALIVVSVSVPVAYADDVADLIDIHPKIVTAYEGATPVKDVIDTKIAEEISVKTGIKVAKEELTKEQIASTSVDKVPYLGLAAKAVMEKEKYPYVIEKTTITIIKSRFDEPTQTMWYWISATRDGQEVAVDNPIWVYPAPKDVVVSEVKDDLKNEITITYKEDPKAAVEEVLRQYVDRQPLGKATVGTKE